MPVLIYKKQGETPLQAINRLKIASPEYQDKTISYAGRLDPMAEGLLLLLIGDENKTRREFEGYEKTYEFDVLSGIETDTYDVLGLPQYKTFRHIPELLKGEIQLYISSHEKRFTQPYPPYSSKTVHGKPLYYWARHNKLAEIQIPTKEVTISAFTLTAINHISSDGLEKSIVDSIKSVSGDFRQEQILSAWERLFRKNLEETLIIATCEVTCSSGTYIRSIVHTMGLQIGCGAIALRIKRTRIGPYTNPTIDR